MIYDFSYIFYQELTHHIILLMDRFAIKFQQPLVSSSSKSDSMLIRQYQANLKIFMKKVEEEVATLIQKYQNQVKELKKQNSKLKQKLNKYEESNPEDQMFRTVLNLKDFSPVKQFNKTEKFLSDELRIFASTSKRNSQQGYNTFKSYLDYEPDELSSSRFEVKKNKSKIHQENLIASLEAGKNNFQANTTKLLDLLGKNQSSVKKQSSSSQEEEVKSNQEKHDVMNTSLSSVCESLDNSFHGKKSKKKNELKRKEKEKIKAMRLEQAKKNYKDRKQLGLKNLLKTLRSNVDSKEQKPLQTLKNLRIAHSGYDSETVSFPNTQKQKKNSSSKSKVLIDPNPVDISQSKSRSNINDTTKKPQSILKQNSTILSKSILSGDN